MTDKNQVASSVWPPKMVVCVGTVVLKEGRALLIRQAEGHSLEGQWSVPWGIVDPDEAPETAAVRETQEESGVTAKVEGLLGYQNLQTPGWIGIAFLCRHVDGVPIPDGYETDAAAYFSLAEMDALSEPIEPWCDWLVRRALNGEHQVIFPEPDNPYQPQMAFL
ncbi:MAG TPA: NUDIX domain-containing protein [Chloroflexi bacterium]|nr:MAG: hypothetical protein B6243_13225 [Anaerolineaceae bacterium 4572_5.2]HEY84125.1 NUDIX domain-containing protein [Chloroflexota bacterium]